MYYYFRGKRGRGGGERLTFTLSISSIHYWVTFYNPFQDALRDETLLIHFRDIIHDLSRDSIVLEGGI